MNAKNTLWDNLAYLSSLHSLPWLVIGNFNDITSPNEQYGGNLASINKCLSFSKKLSICGLLDLSFKGSPFTWSNNHFNNKHELVRERLDRFLCNDKWLNLYPNSDLSSV